MAYYISLDCNDLTSLRHWNDGDKWLDDNSYFQGSELLQFRRVIESEFICSQVLPYSEGVPTLIILFYCTKGRNTSKGAGTKYTVSTCYQIFTIWGSNHNKINHSYRGYNHIPTYREYAQKNKYYILSSNLLQFDSSLLKMAIEIVSFPMKNGGSFHNI